MQESWFPQVPSNIFISHSHLEKEMATSLAGWLKNEFQLNCFIDSNVWGHIDELLKQIDNKYCLDSTSNTYVYEKRNRSTSHVHMILSIALSKMIDETECIIFLNTPSTMKTESVINQGEGTTSSPWIYSEISMSQLMRKKAKEHHREAISKSIQERSLIKNEDLNVSYIMTVNHLTSLSVQDLITWHKNKNLNMHPLDILYQQKQIR